MPVKTALFEQLDPTPWTGRYARIPGETSVFHLEYVRGGLWPNIIWRHDGDDAICQAVKSTTALQLTEAVARAKRYAGGSGGGAFHINEFGQVIVPATDSSGRCVLAGKLLGPLLFENPLSPDERIDLAGDEYLQHGDPWKLPYVGMPFVFNQEGIYFRQCNVHGFRRRITPPRQDDDLIRALRALRPRGGRILVTHAGAVLTKVRSGYRRDDDSSGQPVYVGSIDPNLWFPKE